MSTESTNKIKIPNPKEAAASSNARSLGQVRLLSQRVNDLVELLRTQREMLRQRGMNLPSGALDSLRSLKLSIDAMSKQVTNGQIELSQLRALAETTALINSTLEPSVVLEQVMDTVIQLTGAERGYILMRNQSTGEIDDFAVARGIAKEQLDQSEFTVSHTVIRAVVESGEPVLTDNAQDDPRLKGGASIANLKLLSILAVPLKVRGNVIGVVYVDNRVLKGIFTSHEVSLSSAFADQAAVAIENARLFESARINLNQVTEFRDFMNSIFTSITSGIITLDNNNIIINRNAAVEMILGINPTTETVLGQPIQKVLPHISDDFYDKLNNVRTKGTQELIVAEPQLDGFNKRYWNVLISPLRDGTTGKSLGITIVVEDQTEQKAHEEQLAEVIRYLPKALIDNIHSMDEINVGGEEREISAIFCDVRGFTTFSERLDPEVLMEIINKYLSVASDGITLYEGIVDKYMGDAVTGLFNTQLNPQENHAERAVRAGMSVIYDLYALHEVLPEDHRLYFGIGIHSGMAVLGNVGSDSRKEFAALGEATDISKILQENAGPAEVIISEATYELVKDMFECEQRVPTKTKGRTDLPYVYRVLKIKRGSQTGPLLIDPELADLLRDLDSE